MAGQGGLGEWNELCVNEEKGGIETKLDWWLENYEAIE